MTDQQTREARLIRGLTALADDVPIAKATASHPASRLPAAQRPAGWLAPAMVAAAVALVVLGVTLLPQTQPPSPAAPAAGEVTLPERFPTRPAHIVSVADSPLGRAVALIEFPFDMESIVVGAGRDVYRSIPANSKPEATLLTADGRFLANLRDDGIHLLRLDNRTSRLLPRLSGRNSLAMLAFSPDGSSLVVSEDRRPTSGRRTWLLDMATGQWIPLFGRTATAAAFSPDGQRIAIQVVDKIFILDRSRRVSRQFTVPAGIHDTVIDQLANDDAWSPDGKWLAVAHWERTNDPTTIMFGEDLPELVKAHPLQYGLTEIRFLPVGSDAFPAKAPQSVKTTDRFLGWWSPDRLLLATGPRIGTTTKVTVVPLGGGQPIVISTLPSGVRVSDVAGKLVQGVTSRPLTAPDRDRPTWFTQPIGVIGLAVGLVAVGVGVGWPFLRRRRVVRLMRLCRLRRQARRAKRAAAER